MFQQRGSALTWLICVIRQRLIYRVCFEPGVFCFVLLVWVLFLQMTDGLWVEDWVGFFFPCLLEPGPSVLSVWSRAVCVWKLGSQWEFPLFHMACLFIGSLFGSSVNESRCSVMEVKGHYCSLVSNGFPFFSRSPPRINPTTRCLFRSVCDLDVE